MVMDHLMPSFLDEISKIAASSQSAGYLQSRTGRRPIRAEKLLKKETGLQARKEEKDDGLNEPEDMERETGLGLADATGGV
jgi:hypothetical protein